MFNNDRNSWLSNKIIITKIDLDIIFRINICFGLYLGYTVIKSLKSLSIIIINSNEPSLELEI